MLPGVWRPMEESMCIASKAVGSQYGTAKEAKYVPVMVLESSMSAVLLGLLKAVSHFSAEAHIRSKKSVVILDWAIIDEYTQGDCEREEVIEAIHQLFDLGVPVIVPAGDEHDEKERVTVSDFSRPSRRALFPSCLSANDFPLIVVGCTDQDGSISSFSYRGDHVTSYTGGEEIECEGVEGPVSKSGTSFCKHLPSNS